MLIKSIFLRCYWSKVVEQPAFIKTSSDGLVEMKILMYSSQIDIFEPS
jgi:hypothetical protein